ncbi:MAG TPA: hypothetical protein VI248_07055 [Kineosporiaceae bacterium]
MLGRHAIADTGMYHAIADTGRSSVCLAVQNLWPAATAEQLGVGWVSFYLERHGWRHRRPLSAALHHDRWTPPTVVETAP